MQEDKDVDSMKKTSFGKVIFNILTCSLTILVLGIAINFYYAVGYLLILIIHELGHYGVAKFLKVKVVFGGFTPFGAYIAHENIESCKENALIAIGGPLFGAVLGFIYYVIYHFTGNATFFVLSFTSIVVNLLNLIPVKPLDGGHIAEAISPIICYIGLPVLVYLFVSTKRLKSKIILFIILAIGICQTYNFTRRYKKDSYFKLERNNKIKFIGAYSILVLTLAICAIYLHNIPNWQELIRSIIRFKLNS